MLQTFTKCLLITLLFGISGRLSTTDEVLKQNSEEKSTYPVSVKATVSQNYISRNEQSKKLGVLFDVSTMNMENAGQTQRAPYELAIVLDRSGSMSGAKLDNAKTAMISIVDNMMTGDIIHIIQYDSSVQSIIENGEKRDANKIVLAINGIHAGGATNLFGGLSMAHRMLEASIEKRDKKSKIAHSRIFLFSDGLLNAGVTDHAKILRSIAGWKNNLDITISTFGIGVDFDRDIMTAMAETGRGDFFFIDSAKAIEKVVEIARKDAASIVGTEAVLTLRSANQTGVQVQLSNLYDRESCAVETCNAYNRIDVNDLRLGDSKFIFVEVTVDVDVAGDTQAELLQWSLDFNAKGELFDSPKQSLTGTVGIKTTGPEDEILKDDDKNNNEEAVVFWKLSDMTMMDKEIIDIVKAKDYGSVNFKAKRQKRNSNLFSLSGSLVSFYDSFSGSTMGSVVNNMVRRMSDDKIEAQMERLDEDDVDEEEAEEMVYGFESMYRYNRHPDKNHEEL